MTIVRDDPSSPDEGFAELYAQLPDATDLTPWLELAQLATPPVLYLGVGTGRLAVPLHAAGVELVGVDSHPGMLERLRRRLPDMDSSSRGSKTSTSAGSSISSSSLRTSCASSNDCAPPPATWRPRGHLRSS